MNKTIIETDNLVLFPSAKNFHKVERAHDLVDSLLNEFSHLNDEDIPSYLDDRFDDMQRDIEVQTYESLDAFMNRNKGSEAKSESRDEMFDLRSSIDEINETKGRIKFYLDEIEMFLPKRH